MEILCKQVMQCKNVVGKLVCTESGGWLGKVAAGDLCPLGPGELGHRDERYCKWDAVRSVLRYMVRLGCGQREQQ